MALEKCYYYIKKFKEKGYQSFSYWRRIFQKESFDSVGGINKNKTVTVKTVIVNFLKNVKFLYCYVYPIEFTVPKIFSPTALNGK